MLTICRPVAQSSVLYSLFDKALPDSACHLLSFVDSLDLEEIVTLPATELLKMV